MPDPDGATSSTLHFDKAVIRVGRDDANDVVNADRRLSAFHCELRAESDGWVLIDTGSSNGTWVRRGGRLISIDQRHDYQLPIRPDDEIILGDARDGVKLVIRLESGIGGVVERPVAVSEQLTLQPDSLDELSATFDRSALLALHQHSTQVSRSDTEESLLRNFADCALDLFHQATHISVHMRASESRPDEPTFLRDRHGHTRHLPISRSVRALVLERGHAVAFLDSDDSLGDADSLRSDDVRAGMCVPIMRGDEVTGFTQVDCRGQLLGAFQRRDLEVFAVLTQQFALAVENLKLTQVLRSAVSDLERTQAEMEQLAFYDPLTGLSNRRLFMDRLDRAVQAAKRFGRRACLLYLDLDQFKQVNDTLGHDAGDMLLKELSGRFRSCVRMIDTVARIGGDEFAIVLGDVNSTAAVHTVCEKLLDLLRQPVALRGERIVMSTSIGVALSSDDGADATTLLKHADMALYRAKSRGRNNYQFFTEEMNQEVSERVYVEAQLRQAVDRNQLLQYFQPVRDLRTGALVGVEALLRWQHPERGLVLPDEFIKLAEESGLINTIGTWVVENACRELANCGLTSLNLAVNLAARQLRDPDFPTLVLNTLERTGLPPTRLTLEMTETTLMQTDEVLQTLAPLKALGVKLAIDDFGTGYSSLAYLKALPVDILKLDRSFVSGIPAGPRDAEIASAVIAMAHKLKMRVIAEGIETESQLGFLRDNDCEMGQGFLLGTPSEFHIAVG
ncbi:MAG: EAL domain-containing protein [Pseudomonadota bacterium]